MSEPVTVMFYRLDTGIFDQGRVYSGPAELLSMNTPDGFGTKEGLYDHMSQRVDVTTEEKDVIDYIPDAPPDTEFLTYAWDAEAKRWMSALTDEGVAVGVRADRDLRLSASDWVVARAVDKDEPIPSNWKIYRQALRDISLQEGFPRDVIWPVEPAPPTSEGEEVGQV